MTRIITVISFTVDTINDGVLSSNTFGLMLYAICKKHGPLDKVSWLNSCERLEFVWMNFGTENLLNRIKMAESDTRCLSLLKNIEGHDCNYTDRPFQKLFETGTAVLAPVPLPKNKKKTVPVWFVKYQVKPELLNHQVKTMNFHSLALQMKDVTHSNYWYLYSEGWNIHSV